MACTAIGYSLPGQHEPPMKFECFKDGYLGGPTEADYCPVYGSLYLG